MLYYDMPTPERTEKIQRAAHGRQQGVVVIEDPYDPHNGLAVVRSCEAFGIQRVCFIFREEAKFNPKRLGKSTSSSANKWLDFSLYDSTQTCLNELKADGYEIVATVLDETAESLYTARLEQPKTAILLGNEHRGLSPEAVALADRKLYVPMQGFVQSLNLSVTASIVLYELTRQRMERGMEPYLLPEGERHALAKRFAEQ
jgi:tRNA (guanosine-2'-O-)-methyltransferase